MRKELVNKLNMEFPDVLRCPVNVGDGWYGILKKLLKDLKRSKVNIINVEQEFGGLQVYSSPRTMKTDRMIQRAEDASWNVCEHCGEVENAKRHSFGGYRAVLCPDCASKN